MYFTGKDIANIGSNISEYAKDTKIASMLLKHALHGNRKSMHFNFGENVSADLEDSAILRNGVKKAVAGLSSGQTKYVYASIDYNNSDEKGNLSSTD